MGTDPARNDHMIAPLRWALWLVGVLLAGFGISWAATMPGQEIRGTWATEGYGLQLDIGATFIDVYEVTDISCRRSQRLPAHQWLIRALEDVTLQREGARLRIDVDGTINPIMADSAALSPLCPGTPAAPGTAQENFDVLWQTMNEHYAFFDLHGVNWDGRRLSYRPAQDAVLDDAALLDLFKATLDGLDDGHLSIRTTTGDIYSPSIRPDWHADRHMVRDNTLAQFDALTVAANTGLLYGWATPEISYVYMTHMTTDPGFNVKGADLAQVGFAEVAATFAGAKGIIIDLRYNPGGSDDVALAYASYFTDTARPAFSKSTRTATGYTAPFEVTLEPQGQVHLDQPVILLTSGFTGSAAEIFTMVMRELPQVIVMGTATAGGLSDIGGFTLPNRWALGLSHQRYLAPDGRLYEKAGVPPDIEIPVDVAAARSGADTTLQAAIAQLNR